MKKFKKIVCVSACTATILGAIPFSASADDSVVYGTMNIPYADFYKAEIADSSNAYEVDAVSSATTSKWSKNGEGELFEVTYNQANEDGTGTILGVTYPVAITQAELDSLGENNYGFTELDTVPAAYKKVSVAEGEASFSEVQGSEATAFSGVTVNVSTNTAWGDYLLTTEGTPEDMGAIYGWILNTASGESYAMRHEENIWRGQLAWSAGFVTTEPHGNTLNYEDYAGIMGETITEMVYITEKGYLTVDTSVYVPIKFAGSAEVKEASVNDGKTTFSTTGFPEDYQKKYSIDKLSASITDEEITFTDVLAGSYTLTVSDASGVYADVLADFLLTTDNMPAVYSDWAIVKSESGSDEDFANFLSNISTVSVNGTEYKASGKGSVKIINEDGTINFEAASKDANVFDGSGDYTIAVKATGYNQTLEFTTALDYIPGDISGNGAIDLYDAIEICKSIMGMRTFTEAEKNIADYNCDGEVNLYDAIGIAKEIMNNLR